MTNERPSSRWQRARRALASPGVRFFGLPWGVSMATLTQARDYCFTATSLLSETFAVALVSWVGSGVLAGLLFARLMRTSGASIDHVGRGDAEPPA